MLRQLLNIKLIFKYDMYKDKHKQQETQTTRDANKNIHKNNTEDRRLL